MATQLTSSGASFSDCRQWRYALWRQWDKNLGSALFIGLNPSTANETDNDKTISNCIGFAKRWDKGGIYMLNLYSYCAKYPTDMFVADDPIGPANDESLQAYSSRSSIVVAAWGGSIKGRNRIRLNLSERVEKVLNSFKTPVYCLGKTKDGHPKHPSRLGYNTSLEVYWTPKSL